MSRSLPDGLYDLLVTQRLREEIDEKYATLRPLRDNLAEPLADFLARELAAILASMPQPDNDTESESHQLSLVNDLLLMARERWQKLATESGSSSSQDGAIDLVAEPLQLLESVHRRRPKNPAPATGLAAPWLFTAAKDSPSLLHEIRREIGSADRLDILVSFITVSGVRKLRDVFETVTALGADGNPAMRIRVLTTTYIGATELAAVEELARLPGCEVRVSLDGRRTRLHAKAWLFHRATGFGSAYVGSANLSGAALTGGLEWTVKVAQRTQPAVFARAQAHFETLWADREFERFDPEDDTHRRNLALALRKERGGGSLESDQGPIAFFELLPKTYQADMLEQLTNERTHGRRRNLVVAATGTGKTMVAAFDYARICAESGGRPRILFVAHRREILRQAIRSYREVLRSPEFGDLLTGSDHPVQLEHLFATIDSVSSRDLVEQQGPDYWHTVVIDECHRLAAGQFDAFVRKVKPQILLGLTATPERSDGQPITQHFDARPDGSPAIELRLWHALDLQLLAPFEYYACDDDTDFSQVPWNKSGERTEIDNLVTGNTVRARAMVREWQRLTGDIEQSHALIFCVSVAHARFIADYLNNAKIPAQCVTGETERAIREVVPERLARGEIQAIVTVDLYNEGVDIPCVDTLILLRPTQSPVLFQQQIGRGLRLAPNKSCCLVLDFVGRHRTDFRFDRLLSSLTGLSRRELTKSVEEGFGQLPPGCHIHLQKQAREQVLRSLRSMVDSNWRRLVAELRSYAALNASTQISLADFLHDQFLNLEDVYRSATGSSPSGWGNLKRAAGLVPVQASEDEVWLSKRLGALTHIDDALRLGLLESIAQGKVGPSDALSEAILRRMFCYQIEHQRERTQLNSDLFARLNCYPGVLSELLELTSVLSSGHVVPTRSIPSLEDVPLNLHSRYSMAEILTAVGIWTADHRSYQNTGSVRRTDRKIEILFVTLDKSEGFHDRVAYKDYAISPELFHWQTINVASPVNATGLRYLESDRNGWRFFLFVRHRKKDPFWACGPLLFEKSEGAKPMSITWRLQVPMPISLFRECSVLRGV